MNLAATMSLNATGFTSPLASVRTALTGTLSTLSQMGNIVTGLAALKGVLQGALDPLSKPILMAADMESMNAEFEVMLGSGQAAAKMLGDIKKFAAATPFETTGLAQGAKTLLAFGSAGESVMPTLKMLGDVAGSNQERFNQLTLAYAQIQSTGRLMGQDLLQLINAGFNPLQQISQKTGRSMGELKKDMEDGAISADMVTDAFKAATSEGGRFFGNMDKQSKTFTGLMSTLRDAWAEVQRAFGEPIMTALKPILVEATTTMESMRATARDLGEKFASAITVIFNAFKTGQLSALASLALTVGFQKAVNVLAASLKTVFDAIRSSVSEMFSGRLFNGLQIVLKALADMLVAAIGRGLANVVADLPIAGAADTAKRMKANASMIEWAAGNSLNWGKDEILAGSADFVAAIQKTIDGIKTQAVDDLFGNTPEMQASLDALITSLQAAKENITAAGADIKASPTAAPEKKTTGTGFSIEKNTGDRLSRIGGFIGGSGGPALSLAQRTAAATEKLVMISNKTLDVLSTTTTQGAAWA